MIRFGSAFQKDKNLVKCQNSGKKVFRKAKCSVSTLNLDKISKIWDEMKIKVRYNGN